MKVPQVALTAVIQQLSYPKFCNRDAKVAKNPLAGLQMKVPSLIQRLLSAYL